ncbi:MAG: YraN family protein [Candidatus Omnitrophica bacterium]|nr:YraN family protein [Candidatus Omnitrophota bacterium]
MTFKRKKLGKEGEEAAVKFLRSKGYKIIEKNFSNYLGEIDIIAKDKDTICFVEVKTRSSDQYDSPFEAVSQKKQVKIARVAMSYLQQIDKMEAKSRFDVVGIDHEKEGEERISIVKDAFGVQL